MIHPKALRKARLMRGLSQRKLAELSGISQSSISLIERGLMDPSFSVMEKLSAVLESKGKTLKDVMTSKVLWLKPNDSVRRAKSLMKRHAISQLPVVDGRIVGTVRESDLLKEGRHVKEIMSRPLPQLDISTPVEVAKEILKIENAVIVTDKGRLAGIVTKSDII